MTNTARRKTLKNQRDAQDQSPLSPLKYFAINIYARFNHAAGK